MSQENKDDLENKSGGEGDVEDGLEHAAEQVSKANDVMLASLFVEANQEALSQGGVSADRELFEEKKENYEFKEHVPDPKLLEAIYDSIANKDIHHKKLLEEGVSSNSLVNLVNRFKRFLNLKVTNRKSISLAPHDWKTYSVFYKFWRKQTNFYLGDFSSQVDIYLRNKKQARTMFKLEFASIFFLLIVSFVLMFFSHKNLSSPGGFNFYFSKFIFVSSLLAFLLTFIPPFFFFSLWFSNVNHLHNSRNFHFFLFAIITLSFIFASTSLCSTAVYHLVKWRFPDIVGS